MFIVQRNHKIFEWNNIIGDRVPLHSRYTHDYMDANEYFTISYFPEEYKKILGVLGSKSGREMDKIHASGLTPKKVGETVSFEEAETTIICRKLFRQGMELSNMPEDVVKSLYTGQAPHDIYIGEVVAVLKN